MTSCSILRYSKKAIPQLATAATYQGRSARFFRCAYHAKVMKTLEARSSSVAEASGVMLRRLSAGHIEPAQRPHGALVAAMDDALPAAAERGGDVVGTVVDEYGRGRLEREAPLRLGVDPGVRLHHSRE